MRHGGYNLRGDSRTRSLGPKAFSRVIDGTFPSAADAVSVLLTGEVSVIRNFTDHVLAGGVVSGSVRHDYDPGLTSEQGSTRPFIAYFLYPFTEDAPALARDLLSLSVDMLDGGYGYYFVRDELCFPRGYPAGVAPVLDFQPAGEEGFEIRNWANYKTKYWLNDQPLLRDIYEINLLSKRHATVSIDGLGVLTDWIASGSGRGLLEYIGRERFLWHLTELEMLNIRPFLNRTGVLFSCIGRVYRGV
jgi:hypothetical protein